MGPLVEPEIRRSAGGELRTTLQVRYAYQDIGDYRLYLRSYDGMRTDPTLRARPGDVLRIRLVNDLPPNRDVQPHDQGEGPNRTWVLARVVVGGEPLQMPLPAALHQGPLAPIRAEELTGMRQITFSTRSPATGGDDFREFGFMHGRRMRSNRRVRRHMEEVCQPERFQ